MSQSITTILPVMYHYVRDLKQGMHRELKGRDIFEFRDQLRWVKKNYEIISGDALMDYMTGYGELPEKAALLTFDDGYRDHFDYVMPVLDELKIPGIFFPAGQAIERSEVLDVNKIHFILISGREISKIIQRIQTWVIENQPRFTDMEDFDQLWAKYALPSRYDSKEVVFVKLCLQRGLPREARHELSALLFKEIVTEDETGFATELYLTKAQIAMMDRHGMTISSHCYSHEWIDTLSLEEFETDLDNSLAFLRSASIDTSRWIMCYPYGCNPFKAPLERHVEMMKARNCVMAFTDNGGTADLANDDRFMLPRTDTNDLPLTP